MLIIIIFEVHTVNLDLILFICLLQFSDLSIIRVYCCCNQS